MFKRITIALGLLIAACGVSEAQVQNYALSLSGSSSVDCGPMPQLNGVGTYTFQFWFNPTEWNQNAVLFERGSQFKVSLGAPGELTFKLGSATLTAKSSALKVNTWNQVTLRQKDGVASVSIDNGSPVATINDAGVSDENNLSSFIIGGNAYVGRIDEVRIWDCYLDNEFENYTFTTLTPYVPEYKNLKVYYKMDQEDCANLVDYCAIDKVLNYNNHGILKGGATKVAVTDNTKLPYIINSAYTANERFFDRVIPRDQYLMANDLINIGIQPDADGHLHYISKCDHGTIKGNTKVLSSFEGREGVLSLDGSANSYFEVPASAMNNPLIFSFDTHFYLDEWVDGAYLLRYENADATEGIAIFLDHRYPRIDITQDKYKTAVKVPVIVVRVNGFCYWFPIYDQTKASDGTRPAPEIIKVGQWNHFGISLKNASTASAGDVFNISMNNLGTGSIFNFYFPERLGTGITTKMSATYFADALPTGSQYNGKATFPANGKILIGQGLKGKIDQTVFEEYNKGSNNFQYHMNNKPQMVTLSKPIPDSQVLMRQGAYYDYDDPTDPGFDLYSQDNWLRIMKSAYDGYRGAKFFITVKNPEGANDQNMNSDFISKASFRENFANDLAVLSAPYDGVELDLEWVYDWSSYAIMAKLIREKLPADKIFRVSTHNVTFKFPSSYMQYVDAFTFQQYGPQSEHSTPTHFTSKCNEFVAWGYPKNKIMTSYATTTSNGSKGHPIRGVKDNFFDENYVPSHDAESKVIEEETYYFNGPLQTYDRAKFTRDQGFHGIFYWDMGNDVWHIADNNWQQVLYDEEGNPMMHKYNLARHSTYAISPNVDRYITDVDLNHYVLTGIDAPEAVTETSLAVVCDGGILRVNFPGKELESVAIYNAAGATVYGAALSDGTADITNVAAGIYVLTATATDGQTYTAKFIKK